MAFVYEEERKFDLNHLKEQYEIGPGQYLPIFDKKVYKENLAPFESKSKKTSIRLIETPGPGSYNTNTSEFQRKDEKKCICQKQKILFSDPDNPPTDFSQNKQLLTANVRNKQNYEQLGFSVKEKRFQINKLKNKLGPGDYLNGKNIIQVRAVSAKCSEQKNKIRKIKSGQIKGNLDHIPSIPTKETFGFSVDEHNNLIKKQNPDMFKCFSGIGNDTVGPGSYDLDFPEQWHRTGTNWSKMKTGLSPKNKIRNQSDLLDLKDNDNTTYSSNSRVTIKQLMKHDLENKAKNKMKINQSQNHTNFPGPGYYYNGIIQSSFKQSDPYKKGIFFGSQQDRFNSSYDFILVNNNNKNNNIGPGSYFLNKKLVNKSANRTNPLLCTNNKPIPFSSKSSRFSTTTQSSKSLTNIPGPGSYETQSSISSNHFSKTSTAFYAHQKRFIEAQKELDNKKYIPGPGSYLNPFSNAGTSDTVNYNGRYVDTRLAQQLSRKVPQESNSQKNEEKCAIVGEYNPQMSTTIEYNNLRKCNSGLSGRKEVAFNSSSPQTYQILQIDNVGPGSYLKMNKVNYIQRKIPFGEGASRMGKKLDLSNEDKERGPGKYNYDILYSWNKKSFNIKYI